MSRVLDFTSGYDTIHPIMKLPALFKSLLYIPGYEIVMVRVMSCVRNFILGYENYIPTHETTYPGSKFLLSTSGT
jgi:hypothetical protein